MERRGLGRRIRWCGKTDDPESAYAEVDALLVPSERENLPRVVLEAMGSGLPVVATGTGSTGEAVWDGVSGWLFDPDHPEEGAEQLRRLVNDPVLWKSQSTAAVRAAGRFDVTTVGNRLEQLYGDVLGNGTRLVSSAPLVQTAEPETGGPL
jgi:glycosyltransferase involved in cell wall biosynthesis